MLADWSHLPFEWMEGDDDAACFAALRALPRADKEKLFAAAVARTVKGQLAFEHDARPELEATVARLDIDFAKHVRPTADSFWSRIRKSRILDIARETLGAAWASTRSKYKKADLAKSMEEAFAAGTPPVGIGATMHAAALAWTIPGFAAFDTGGAAEEEAAATEAAGNTRRSGQEHRGRIRGCHARGEPRTTSVVESIESPGVAERRAAALRRPRPGTATANPSPPRMPASRRRSGHRCERQRPRRSGAGRGRGRPGDGERRGVGGR